MKKILLLSISIIIVLSGVVFAQDSDATKTTKFTDKLQNVSKKVDSALNDVDAKMEKEYQKAKNQQVKFSKNKVKNDKKIKEKQEALKKSYNANQRRLQQKKEELNKLLEE